MFTVQIARISLSGRFQDRTCTDTKEECDAFVADNADWTVVYSGVLTAEEIEARSARAEWARMWNAAAF